MVYTIILIIATTIGFGPTPAFLSERFPTEEILLVDLYTTED
jgi:hypothetical protein